MWEDWDQELIITFFSSTHGQGPDDVELQEAFYAGWIDRENTADDRMEAREVFFDLMGELGYPDAEDDFDWDDWRDWYEDAA